TYLTGITDVSRQWADCGQTCACAPLFKIFQRGGVQGDRVLARVKRSMMNRVIRLRLRATSILRDEAIHQIEDHLLCDDGIGIDLCETFSAKAGALSKTAPVIDVWNCHVINATGDSICLTYTHHRNVDDFGYFIGNDLGKMTHVARVLGIGGEGHFSRVPKEFKIAPNQFPK